MVRGDAAYARGSLLVVYIVSMNGLMQKIARCLVLMAPIVCACARHTESSRAEPKPTVESSAPPQPSAPAQPSAQSRPSLTPAAAFQAIVGCWQLEDSERWSIQATPGGAEIKRTLLKMEAGGAVDYAARASQPSKVMFDEQQQTYAFATAGRVHALLFSFTLNDDKLDGGWAVSRAPGAKYEPQGVRVQLRRCDAP